MRSIEKSLAVTMWLLSWPALAGNSSLRDLTVEQAAAAAVGGIGTGPITVSLLVDHADKTYALGELAHLFIRAQQDAYVTVFDVGPTLQVTELFPNQYQTDNHISANQQIEIAGGNSGAKIIVSGPVGSELIKVIVSRSPNPIIAKSELNSHGFFRDVVGGVSAFARDLEVAANQSQDNSVEFFPENFILHTVGSRPPGVAPGGTLTAVDPLSPAELPVRVPPKGGAGPATADRVFPLLISLDRTVYRIGEDLNLTVTPMKTCHLTVFDIASSGSVHELFPGFIQGHNPVAAGRAVSISGGSSPVTMRVSGPPGTEQILAICTTNTHQNIHRLRSVADRAGLERDIQIISTNEPKGQVSISSSSFRIQE